MILLGQGVLVNNQCQMSAIYFVCLEGSPIGKNDLPTSILHFIFYVATKGIIDKKSFFSAHFPLKNSCAKFEAVKPSCLDSAMSVSAFKIVIK